MAIKFRIARPPRAAPLPFKFTKRRQVPLVAPPTNYTACQCPRKGAYVSFLAFA